MYHTINLEPSTSSREQGEESLPTFCLDTYLSELAKLNPTQETSCSHDSGTDTYQPSPSGTMSAPSTESRGWVQLTFFAEDSRVKTSAQQEKELALLASVRACGESMRDSLERCGLSLSLPKTHLCFALGDLELSSKIWPRWGMMLGGECWELATSVRPTKEIGCGSWPTPVRSDFNLRRQSKGWKGNDLVSQVSIRHFNNALIGLDADPVEKLMGWPIGWTDLKPLATDKFHKWLRSHSPSSQKD
jgi:hypothetical protein